MIEIRAPLPEGPENRYLLPSWIGYSDADCDGATNLHPAGRFGGSGVEFGRKPS